MPPKPEKRRTSKSKQSAQQQPATPLDARQRALHEELEKIKLREQKLKQLIKEAPKLAEIEQKRRREELVSRSMERTRRIDAPTRLDTRYYEASVAEATQPSSRNRRHKALRTQQRQARLIFCGLLFALIILVLWLWSVWKW